jgi:hypothetical protein
VGENLKWGRNGGGEESEVIQKRYSGRAKKRWRDGT